MMGEGLLTPPHGWSTTFSHSFKAPTLTMRVPSSHGGSSHLHLEGWSGLSNFERKGLKVQFSPIKKSLGIELQLVRIECERGSKY